GAATSSATSDVTTCAATFPTGYVAGRHRLFLVADDSWNCICRNHGLAAGLEITMVWRWTRAILHEPAQRSVSRAHSPNRSICALRYSDSRASRASTLGATAPPLFPPAASEAQWSLCARHEE